MARVSMRLSFVRRTDCRPLYVYHRLRRDFLAFLKVPRCKVDIKTLSPKRVPSALERSLTGSTFCICGTLRNARKPLKWSLLVGKQRPAFCTALERSAANRKKRGLFWDKSALGRPWKHKKRAAPTQLAKGRPVIYMDYEILGKSSLTVG